MSPLASAPTLFHREHFDQSGVQPYTGVVAWVPLESNRAYEPTQRSKGRASYIALRKPVANMKRTVSHQDVDARPFFRAAHITSMA